MRGKYPRRSQLLERIEVAVTPELKQQIFAAAAAKDKPASQFIREAIGQSVADHASSQQVN